MTVRYYWLQKSGVRPMMFIMFQLSPFLSNSVDGHLLCPCHHHKVHHSQWDETNAASSVHPSLSLVESGVVPFHEYSWEHSRHCVTPWSQTLSPRCRQPQKVDGIQRCVFTTELIVALQPHMISQKYHVAWLANNRLMPNHLNQSKMKYVETSRQLVG